MQMYNQLNRGTQGQQVQIHDKHRSHHHNKP